MTSIVKFYVTVEPFENGARVIFPEWAVEELGVNEGDTIWINASPIK